MTGGGGGGGLGPISDFCVELNLIRSLKKDIEMTKPELLLTEDEAHDASEK